MWQTIANIASLDPVFVFFANFHQISTWRKWLQPMKCDSISPDFKIFFSKLPLFYNKFQYVAKKIDIFCFFFCFHILHLASFRECPHPRALPYTSEPRVWHNRQVDEDKKGNTSKNVAWVVCQVRTSSILWLWFQLLGKQASVTTGTTCAYADSLLKSHSVIHQAAIPQRKQITSLAMDTPWYLTCAKRVYLSQTKIRCKLLRQTLEKIT